MAVACGKDSGNQNNSNAQSQKSGPNQGNQQDNITSEKVVELLRGTTWFGPFDENGKSIGSSITINFDSSQDSFSFLNGVKGPGVYLGPADGSFKVVEQNGEFHLMTTNPSTGTFNGQTINRAMAIVTYQNGTVLLRREVLTSLVMRNGQLDTSSVRIEHYRKH
jgi:hypothetical protein